MRKVTIEDISRHTGLSRGTVSRALNNRADISEATKSRVLAACKELDYVRSAAARSLATGRHFAVGVLMNDMADAFTTAFLRGVLSVAEKADYAVHLLELTADPARLVEKLRSPTVDCLAIAARLSPENNAALAQNVGALRIGSSWPIEGLSSDVFMPDYEEAGRMIARRLAETGAEAPLFAARSQDPDAEIMKAAFEQAWAQRGARADTLSLDGDLSTATTLSAAIERADAIAASDDWIAARVMLECARLGRNVGADLPLVGCGAERIGLELRPALSTVDPGGEEIGRRSMETLLQRLQGERMDSPQTIRVAPRLIERESSAARRTP